MTVTGIMPPAVKRVRAYFAPVQRAQASPTLFDPAQSGAFALDAAPAPWIDLGWIRDFVRKSETVISPVRMGAPAQTHMQVRTDLDATVHFSFESWGKLQMSLSSGTQQMNLLAVATGGAAAGSGGTAIPAVGLGYGSSATSLNVGAVAAGSFPVGSIVAVDSDYVSGTGGFIGSGVSGAYLRAPVADVDYVRRITLNVGRVHAVSNGVLTLETPLLAGAPTATMKVSSVVGFCDREGSTFFQEWSALFLSEGQQGERVLWHYPRLQSMSGIAEVNAKGVAGYDTLLLAGAFRAMPVSDPVDGESVVCFRSYLAG